MTMTEPSTAMQFATEEDRDAFDRKAKLSGRITEAWIA